MNDEIWYPTIFVENEKLGLLSDSEFKSTYTQALHTPVLPGTAGGKVIRGDESIIVMFLPRNMIQIKGSILGRTPTASEIDYRTGQISLIWDKNPGCTSFELFYEYAGPDEGNHLFDSMIRRYDV